jgi:hypothetical protein
MFPSFDIEIIEDLNWRSVSPLWTSSIARGRSYFAGLVTTRGERQGRSGYFTIVLKTKEYGVPSEKASDNERELIPKVNMVDVYFDVRTDIDVIPHATKRQAAGSAEAKS